MPVASMTGVPTSAPPSSQMPATVSVTGAGLSLSPDADYANNVNAGTATASYTFAGDDNHFGSDDSADFEIGKIGRATGRKSIGGPVSYAGPAQTPATG